MRATRLPNGIRVLTEEMPDLPSVSLGLWVESGSRDETSEQAGISHFLEHLFFKGTERRTAARIAEDIDAVGGVLNAFTNKEYTCYYARVLAEHLDVALDLLGDTHLHSRFPADEIDRERSVILQEISMSEDTPDDHVHDLFGVAFWPGHPLARPVAGSAATVTPLRRDDFVRFRETHYRPDRLILAAAGRLSHDRLAEAAEGIFGGLTGASTRTFQAPPSARPGLTVHPKALEQVHICLGVPGIPQNDPDRYAAHVLTQALGGGMSSRLFQEIRERRGKAYTVFSFLPTFHDGGYLGVYVGTSAGWAREVVDVVRAEFAALADKGLRSEELARTKAQIKGNMLLALETSESRMGRLARNEMYFGRDVPLDEIAQGIDAVGPDDVIAMARRLLRPETLAITVLGDVTEAALGSGILDS